MRWPERGAVVIAGTLILVGLMPALVMGWYRDGGAAFALAIMATWWVGAGVVILVASARRPRQEPPRGSHPASSIGDVKSPA